MTETTTIDAPGAPKEEDDDSLIVCVAEDTGRGYLPVSYYEPLVNRIAELIAQCTALQARLDRVAQIAGGQDTVTPT